MSAFRHVGAFRDARWIQRTDPTNGPEYVDVWRRDYIGQRPGTFVYETISWGIGVDAEGLEWLREQVNETPRGWRTYCEPVLVESVEVEPLVFVRAWNDFSILGFGVRKYFREGNIFAVKVPHWVLVVVFGAAFARSATPLARASRRRRHGLCPTCGYDGRGLGSRVVCSECGVRG